MAKAKQAAAARDEALEAAIAADPSRPEPWRVYSDWLQQQGDPRGELIAVQSALATTKGPEWGRLKVRELQLLEGHAEHFYGPLKKWRAARRTDVEWKNGYLRSVMGRTLQPALMELFAHPSARFLEQVMLDDGELVNAHPDQPFTDLAVNGEKLAPVLGLERLERLSLGFTRWPSGLDHPRVERLWWARPTAEQVRALGASALPRLTHLSLWASGANLEAVNELLAGRELAARLELDLSVDDSPAPLDPAAAARVERLDLHHTGIDWLTRLPPGCFDRVRGLEVSAPPGDQRDTYFQKLPPLPGVRQVRLTYPDDLVGWFRSFATGALAAQVEELEVGVAKPAAGRALGQGRYPRLNRLRLSFEATLGPEFLEAPALLASQAWSEVRALELSPMRHFPVLAASPLAGRLEELTVELESDRDGELLLAHLDQLTNLKRLRLRGERIDSPEVITRLAALPVELQWLGTRRDSSWE